MKLKRKEKKGVYLETNKTCTLLPTLKLTVLSHRGGGPQRRLHHLDQRCRSLPFL